MNWMEERIAELGKQFSILQKKLEEQKENGEKKTEEVICSTRNEIDQLATQMKQRCVEGKDMFTAELLETQFTLRQKREERKEQLARKYAEQKKRKAEIEVEAAAEYAQAAMEFSLLALDEATLAFYEAVDQADQYHQMYGENE